MIRVGIAEDNPKFRSTLAEALGKQPGIELCFVASNGKEALQACLKEDSKPQVVLMDIEMPIMNGIEATGRLKQLAPEVKVLMLSILDQDQHLFDAIVQGAAGYMVKGESPERLVQAIQDVMENRLPLSPVLALKALSFLGGQQAAQKKGLEDHALTTREIEVLKLLTQAKHYKEIAEALFISERTVRNHIHHIYKKIQVSSKAEALRKAWEEGWFD